MIFVTANLAEMNETEQLFNDLLRLKSSSPTNPFPCELYRLGTESKPYIQGRASGRYETLENESQI